ncbi:MAG: hypothetical protein K2V38_04120, partial [Gemmataceae bacterium]|nr:hypothetical protein [Gemmataceae bacterium]
TLPPGGVSHARYLLVRLRQRFPDLKLLVGRWGAETALTDAREETLKNTDGVDRTLADTRKRLAELRPVLEAQQTQQTIDKPSDKSPARGERVGTAGA